MRENMKATSHEGQWLKLFLPNARPLTEAEIKDLPPEKKQITRETGEKGIWVEVLCPDQSCLAGGGKIQVSAEGAPEKETKGFWLNLFCPEKQCVIDQATDLP
jgi:hypothetical protein